MRQNCTRSRSIALSLLCFVSAEFSYGCAMDRFYRLKSPTPCVTDCVRAAQLGEEPVFEYPVSSTRGAFITQVSRSALVPIVLEGRSPPIPIESARVRKIASGFQPGCRFGSLPFGLEFGVRPGMSFGVTVFTSGSAQFHVLRSEDGRTFGVYDVATVKLE